LRVRRLAAIRPFIGAPSAAMTIQQFVNQARGLQSVELPDADAEQVNGNGFDLLFVETVFPDDFLDEVSLLFRAAPGAIRATAAGVARRTLRVGIAIPCIGRLRTRSAGSGLVVHPVGGGVGHEADLLNLVV